MREVLNKIHQYFDFLFENGFEIYDSLRSGGFGNWIVYLQSKKFIVKVIQDRNEISVSLAPPYTRGRKLSDLHFISLDAVIGFFSKDVAWVFFQRTPNDIDAQFIKIANEMKSNYEKICAFFERSNYANTKEELELYLENRREHFLGPYGYKHRKG